MVNVKCHTSASVLLRVGKTVDINNDFITNSITFGCAANWIDYTRTKGNTISGDLFECVFAHLKMEDPRIGNLKDKNGNPFGDNIIYQVNPKDNTVWLSFEPTILMPAFCLFGIDVPGILKSMNRTGPKTTFFTFDLDKYCIEMGYQINNAGFLVITDPYAFFDDLRVSIPMSVEQNRDNLTSERFYSEFNPAEPLLYRDVEYGHFSDKDIFYDYRGNYDEMFWKQPKYCTQSELRLLIPNINFIQKYNPLAEVYDYTRNQLNVTVPGLQTYSAVYHAKDYHSLIFYDFSPECMSYKMKVSKMTVKEIRNNSGSDQGILIDR